jgi:hypothetical protein
MFHTDTYVESILTISSSISLFIYPHPPASTRPLIWTILRSYSLWFKCVFIAKWEFCLGILPVNVLCLNQSNPSTTLPHPTLYCSAVFSVFCCVLSLCSCDVFHYYPFSIFLFFFLPPPLDSFNSPTFGNVFYIYLYLCITMIVFILDVSSVFHMWEKTCDLCLSKPG